MLSRRSLLALGGAGLIGVGGVSILAFSTRRDESAEIMSPEDAFAAAATGDVLLVDIRRPDEWQATGVPQHAIALDLRDPGFLQGVIDARATKTQPVALICARGVRSARLTVRLAEAGISPIIDVPEGMLGSLSGPGWLKRGLPVVRVQ